MRVFVSRFWRWYEKYYAVNVGVAAGLFLLQLVHLYWLSADVVALRLLGKSFFELTGFWRYLVVVVDYIEIPSLVSVSLVYINSLRKEFSWGDVLFLVFLNSQWLHIFWITDEFAVESLGGAQGTVLPVWLAWVAILIDYLELPVMFDTVKRFIVRLRVRE